MTTNQYIATDIPRTAIYGLGITQAAAIADAASGGADTAGLITLPCSKALVRQVDEQGGNISWDEIDGIAVTAASGYATWIPGLIADETPWDPQVAASAPELSPEQRAELARSGGAQK